LFFRKLSHVTVIYGKSCNTLTKRDLLQIPKTFPFARECCIKTKRDRPLPSVFNDLQPAGRDSTWPGPAYRL
ncbi:hypothetical protein, partial [Thiolapillus sp.]|uniref:hypothetical protein n=1 Tax=Thiolapillus sp. TaxID=2017437 RepID=UPI003AF58A39